RAEGTHELRFGSGLDPVEDVDLEPPLPSEKGGEEPDRPRPRHEDGPRLPEGTPADGYDLLPGLRDHGRGLEQDAEDPEGAVDLDHIFGIEPPALGHEAVDLFDATFGVLAVAAHVPLTHRAVRARNGIGAADDTDHKVSLVESPRIVGFHHAAE